jgi:hypothetical protein
VPERNAEIVRRAFAAPDLSGFMAALADDIVWDLTTAGGPEADVFEGRARTEEFLRRWLGAWDEYRMEIDELVEAGDRVVVIGRQRGRSKVTGIAVEMPHFAVWTLRGGRAVRVEVHSSRAEAMTAAGLAE